MYRLGQIFTSTEFLKNYRALSRLLRHDPQPILITHKSGERFVFVNADLFDDLLIERLQQQDPQFRTSSIREQLFFKI